MPLPTPARERRAACRRWAAGVLCGAEGVSPFSPEAVHASEGAVFRMPVRVEQFCGHWMQLDDSERLWSPGVIWDVHPGAWAPHVDGHGNAAAGSLRRPFWNCLA